MEYKFEIIEIDRDELELMPLGINKRHYFKSVIYYEIEKRFLWVKWNKRVVVYEGCEELRKSLAIMDAEAIIDILNCRDISEINHILYSKWGYKQQNSKINLKEYYPQFYKKGFEPFFSQYEEKYNEKWDKD